MDIINATLCMGTVKPAVKQQTFCRNANSIFRNNSMIKPNHPNQINTEEYEWI